MLIEGSLHVICIEVIVELTEADYQMKEGFGDVLTARVSYSRELANPITLRFFPVTYDRYERVLGLILPSDFPSIDIRASGKNFCVDTSFRMLFFCFLYENRSSHCSFSNRGGFQ